MPDWKILLDTNNLHANADLNALRLEKVIP